MTTLFLFSALLLLILINVPIAVALGLSSILTIVFFSDDSLPSMALKLLEAESEHYTFLAIPFFILASSFLSTGGVARRIIDFAIAAIGHIRGGLAMASVLACMFFAAISGSSPATVAAIGSIVIAGMVRAGYPQAFAAGVIANAGTLGILIPPSIIMLVYAAATEVSAARMFEAGFLPGLLMGLLLMIAIYIIAHIKKLPAQPFPGFKILLKTGFIALGGLMLVFLVLGSIYGGIASPTEAASLAAVYAFIIAVYGYRDIGPLKGIAWQKKGDSLSKTLLRNLGYFPYALVTSFRHDDVRQTVLDAAKVSIMLLFIIGNAMLFAHVLTSERIPHMIAESITSMGLSPWMFLLLVNIILLIAGNFMEPSAILLIMAPIFFPIATQLGIDPIHLGIIMVVNMEIGMLTPPVGLNLFVTAGITGNDMGWVIKAVFPWLSILLLFLMLITYIPEISLFFPEYLDKLRE